MRLNPHVWKASSWQHAACLPCPAMAPTHICADGAPGAAAGGGSGCGGDAAGCTVSHNNSRSRPRCLSQVAILLRPHTPARECTPTSAPFHYSANPMPPPTPASQQPGHPSTCKGTHRLRTLLPLPSGPLLCLLQYYFETIFPRIPKPVHDAIQEELKRKGLPTSPKVGTT